MFRGLDQGGSCVGVVHCTILYWSVFVEIIKEPYISPAAPKGLLLPADLHTGRRVMKQASLEIHHCGEPRQFSLSFPPTPLFFCLLKFFFFLSHRALFCWTWCSASGSNTWELLRVLSQQYDCLTGSLLPVSFLLSQKDWENLIVVWQHVVPSESQGLTQHSKQTNRETR